MKNFPKKILLMGYMASGKSTIGRILAQKMDCKFIDLDDFIAAEEALTIPQIFDTKGETYFRKKELIYLKEILSTDEKLVLSVGGGTPTFYGAIELINELSYSIYLKASIQTLFDRLVPEKTERPLLTKIPDEVLQEYIAVHLFERSSYYQKADLSISIDKKNTKNIVDEIVDKIKLL